MPDYDYLLMADGSATIPVMYVMNTDWDTPGTKNISNNNVVALNGVCVTVSNSDYMELYIEETLVNGKHSLSADGSFIHYNGLGYISLPFFISTPDYQSMYNDITPFIDAKGGYQVYFASDRYEGDSHKGDYDLYRYNIYTYIKLNDVKKVFVWDAIPPSITNTSFVDGQMLSTGPNLMVLSVSDNFRGSGVFGVYYSLNNSTFFEIPYSNGYSAFITIAMGNNVIKTYAVDNAWNSSKTNSMTIIGK